MGENMIYIQFISHVYDIPVLGKPSLPVAIQGASPFPPDEAWSCWPGRSQQVIRTGHPDPFHKDRLTNRNGDLMGFYGDLMGFNGGLVGLNGI